MTTENLSTLKINLLTQVQYDNAVENGTVEMNSLYLTPEEVQFSTATNLVNGTAFGSVRAIGTNTEGVDGYALGDYSFAEGELTHADGYASHAEGSLTHASGDMSHAEGYDSIAFGDSSHAEGSETIASGDYTHSEGYRTKARGKWQHVQGKYNVEDTSNAYAHIVGNGAYNNPSNAHTLDWNGNAWFAGDIYVGSTAGKNKDDGSKKLVTVEEMNEAIATAISNAISQSYD